MSSDFTHRSTKVTKSGCILCSRTKERRYKRSNINMTALHPLGWPLVGCVREKAFLFWVSPHKNVRISKELSYTKFMVNEKKDLEPLAVLLIILSMRASGKYMVKICIEFYCFVIK
ncbi:uncharacterized protein LOC110117847 [Ceratitis capitata]|uniref:uncharacterized protein LOC110117847 n=1 Tax=Ceratitis capitata TaxID=7213 RepID=UPI000A11B213|nr:uncharacterized protein LOC110117847 [Ceratitis capitata]